MNDSLSRHGGLTPGREGKGREEEGKGEDRGVRMHSSFGSVPREAHGRPMHAGQINSAQARALAVFVNTIRPDWDVPGIAAALHRARHRAPVDELATAAIRFARRDDLRTPAVFADDGTHWLGLPVAEARAPQRPKCPTHGIAVRLVDGLCTGCVADQKAADDNRDDTLAISHDQLVLTQRGVDLVRAAMAKAMDSAIHTARTTRTKEQDQ